MGRQKEIFTQQREAEEMAANVGAKQPQTPKPKQPIKTLTQRDILNALYKDCGLLPEDTYKHKKGFYTIITRTGIEKIQRAKDINVTFDIVKIDKDYAAVKAYGVLNGRKVETFGEASPANCTSSYYLMLAEKRALSRVVLKLVNAYEFNIYGQDEADDFKKQEKEQSKNDLINKLKNK